MASVNGDRSQPPFGLSLPKWPCAHSDLPFDKAILSFAEGLIRANGDFVMCNGKLNKPIAGSN
jgi:hypothetical protein